MRVRVLALVALALVTAPAVAWSPSTAQQIALEAASIAPADLKRQIERHERVFVDAVLDEARYPSAAGEPLEKVIEGAAARSIEMIRTHQPFPEIIRQLGAMVYYVAYANNPLVIGRSDPDESSYYRDYLAYVDSARPRFAVVFYGLVPEFESSGDVSTLIERTFGRGRALYPLVGREYRRIGGSDGRQHFDDRSTAFGISAVAFSQSVTDAALLLRHIWIEAGGVDERTELPVRKGVFQVQDYPSTSN